MSSAAQRKARAITPAGGSKGERRRDRRLAWLVGLLCLSTGAVLLVVYGLRALISL